DKTANQTFKIVRLDASNWRMIDEEGAQLLENLPARIRESLPVLTDRAGPVAVPHAKYVSPRAAGTISQVDARGIFRSV
ncbi:MAG: hypothetical protein RLN70_06695, partial [Rhodospirillaceae bacterium]